MRRRDFLGGIGIGAAGSLLISNSANASTNPRVEFAKGPSDRPLDVRLAIKPVFIPLIHSDLWEGPCRSSAGEGSEQERAAARNAMKTFSEMLKTNVGEGVQLLEPVYMEYSEDFYIRPEELAKLEPDRDKVDIYLVGPAGMYNYAATVVAETFHKPVMLVGSHFIVTDAIAYLSSRGLEGHGVFGFQDFNNIISLLRTRKVFQQTNILIITDRDLPPIPVRSGIWDVNMLKDKFGIGTHFVSYREFTNEMDEVLDNRELGEEAEGRAEQLINNADEVFIDKQYVKRSFEFYYAVKNLMKKYGCNAFTVECFEFCASRLAEKYKITPCLVHTLLKDEGIASACEADLNALLAMRLLMSVANKSSFMGNPVASSEDQIAINHSVPGMKMAGYKEPDLPYHLRHFVKSGWGTKVMIDFAELDEKTVTLARFNSFCTKIYLAKGEVVDCTGFEVGDALERLQRGGADVNPEMVERLRQRDEEGLIDCTLTAHIKVPDARESMRKLNGFGSHLTMVYGDYVREIHELADMLDLEVVQAT